MYRGPIDYARRPDLRHPLARRLLAWFLASPLQAARPTVYDRTGRYRATLQGSDVGWARNDRPGRLGPCPTFVPALAQYMDLAALIPALNGAAGATLAFWTHHTSGQANVAMRGPGSNVRYGILWSGSSLLAFCETGSAGASRSSTRAETGWHHIVFVFDGSLAGTDRTALYFDGVAIGAASGTPPATLPTATTFHVGRYQAGGVFQAGPTDDVAVWNRALTPAEARAWYDSSRMGHPGLLRRPSVPLLASITASSPAFQPWFLTRPSPVGVGVY